MPFIDCVKEKIIIIIISDLQILFVVKSDLTAISPGENGREKCAVSLCKV